jgi:hypothetical protein
VGRASVVLPDGRVRQVLLPATAAELMLEAPGHFLTDVHAAPGLADRGPSASPWGRVSWTRLHDRRNESVDALGGSGRGAQ